MKAECSCSKLNTSTDGNEDRIGIIADAAPDCACENASMSQHSPHPVQQEETIARMVCIPMHVNKKKPELLPSFFNHAFSYGMSAQRLEKASDAELADWVSGFVSGADDRVWLGYIQASCKTIREVLRPNLASRAFCVYDAALESNPAHAEVCSSHRIIEDADRLEARANLRRAFSGILPRATLKNGQVQSLVRADLLARPVANHWQELVT